MRRATICDFIDDEEGAYTIWALFWFIVFLMFGGLAVDTTNGFRVQTMMQATADAAAHAAAVDLPDFDAAEASAFEYTEKNMPVATWGNLLSAGDIDFGHWDIATRTFTPSEPPSSFDPPDAVRLTLRSSEATGNPVVVTLLRIVGLSDWDINVDAIAVHALPDNCLLNGFVSRGKVFSGSQNSYVDKLSIHGQLGVKVGSTPSSK